MIKRQTKIDNFGEIGERLRLERLKTGLIQADFGALGGASLQTQMRYETGQQMPKIEYLLNLQLHGVDIGYILIGARSGQSLGYMEQQVLEMFGKMPSRMQATVVELLTHLTGSYVDLRELPTTGQSLHSNRLGYKPRPEDL
jgi:hypothetical protein